MASTAGSGLAVAHALATGASVQAHSPSCCIERTPERITDPFRAAASFFLQGVSEPRRCLALVRRCGAASTVSSSSEQAANAPHRSNCSGLGSGRCLGAMRDGSGFVRPVGFSGIVGTGGLRGMGLSEPISPVSGKWQCSANQLALPRRTVAAARKRRAETIRETVARTV
jgi:hypothetical protein